jgi:hypothetical protein
MMNTLKHLFVILACTALANCTTIDPNRMAVTNLYDDNETAVEDIRHTGVAIVGLIGDDGSINEFEKSELDNQFHQSLQQQFGYDLVFEQMYLANRLDYRAYELLTASPMMDTNIAELANDDRQDLAGISRYIAHYEILDNNVNQHTRDNWYERCYYTSRNISVKLTIVDTHEQQQVWSRQLDNQTVNHHCVEDEEEDEKNGFASFLVDLAVAVVTQDFELPYPEAPTLGQTLEETFAHFKS